ncbi:24871_t:CDS:1, partial [Racocetra persica]
CIMCAEVYPTCDPNSKCYVWRQDCFTCAQSRCVPENYDQEG